MDQNIYDKLLTQAPSQNQPDAGSSVYDNLIQQERKQNDDRLRQVLAGAVKINPDKAGEAQRLQQETGVPTNVALGSLEEIKQRAALIRAQNNELMKYSPVLRRQLTDMNFAMIAHDQTQELGLLEEAGRKVGAFVSGPVGWAGGGLEGFGYALDAAWRKSIAGIGAVVLPKPQSAQTSEIDYESLAPGGLGEGWSATGSAIGDINKEYIEPGGQLSKTEQVLSGLGQAGTQILAYTNPFTGAMATGLNVGYGAKIQQDKIDLSKLSLEAPQSDKDWQILAGGSVTAASEYVVSKLMLKTPQAFALKSKMLDYSAKIALGATQEGLQEYSENIAHDVLAIVMTDPEAKIKWSEAAESGEIGAIVGGVIQSIFMSALHIRARGQQRAFENLNDAAKAQKIRERSPQQYENFSEAVATHLAATSEGAVTDVYVQTDVFRQALQDAGISPDAVANALPGVAEQLADSTDQSDIVIPMKDWIGKVAGTEVGDALTPHVRSGEDAVSITEAIEAQKAAKDMQAKAAELIAQKQETDEFVKSANAVQKQIYDQLKGAQTYTDKVARSYSQFVRDFVVTQSAALKMQPQEFYDKYMYKVRSERQMAAEPAVATLFDQDGRVITESPAFQEFFGNSMLANEQGDPVVLYHGTADDVVAFDVDHPNRKDTGWLGTGVYLTDSPELGEMYAEQKKRTGEAAPNVMPLYARLENPYMATAEDKARIKAGGRAAADAFTQQLQEQGYDGVILQVAPDAREIVVFDPTSVKSVFNSGTWSRETEDLLAQRGKPQVEGKAVPEAIDALANVESAFQFAATQTFKTNRDFKLAIQNRVLAAAKAAKVDLSDFTANVERYLVRVAMQDAVTALDTNPNAVGWYNEKVTKALRIISLIHPEVATDAEAKFAFTWALAVTSNGLKVDKNFELAERAYRAFKETGRMPTDLQAGQAQIAINESLDLYNQLVDKYGLDRVIDFMTTRQTVKDVEAFTGKNVSGENLTTEVYGAAALGPKIGNGFFANLYGHFEQLTMDRWLMRTWGRWTATLVEENKANVKLKQGQLKALIKLLSPAEKKAFEAIIKTKLAVGKLDEVAKAINKASMKPANRVAMAKIADAAGEQQQAQLTEIFGELKKGQKRVSFGDELRKTGNALTKYLDGQKEAPSGPPERGRIRKVMGQVLTELQQQHPDLTMSDLQALLWYPEKRLYDSAKTADEGQTGYEDNEAPDYANAAAALAEELGVPKEEINRTIEEVDNELSAAKRAAGAERVAGDGLFRQAARAAEAGTVVFEVAPDPNNAELTSRWNELTAQQRLDASKRVAQQIVSDVLSVAGASGQLTDQIGSYQDFTNPSFAIRLVDGDPMEVARALGFVLSQDSMMAIAPTPFEGSFEAGAIRIAVGEKTEAEIDEIYQALRGIEGQPQIQGQTTSNGYMTILLDEGVDAEALANAMDETLGGQYEIETHSINAAFPEKQEYDYASAESDPGGDAGLARQRYRDARSKATRLVESEIADATRKPGDGGVQRLRASDLDVATAYGQSIENSTSVVGIHYSRQPRTSLAGHAYGTGLKGAEATRLAGADSRLSSRVHFYVDTGSGIRPEAGVGGNVHAVTLNNLYNTAEDPLGIVAQVSAQGRDDKGMWFNGVESAVLDAGFDGVYIPEAQGTQGVAVLLGPKHTSVPVEQHGTHSMPAAGAYVAPSVGKRKYGMLSSELRKFEAQKDEILAVAPSAEIKAGNLIFDETDAAAIAQFFPGAERAGELRQPTRGGFDPKRLTTILNEQADYSTFLHETAHFFLTVYADMAAMPDAPPQVQQDMQTLLNWFGVKDVDTWNAMSLEEQRKYHEQFAYNFEIYLFEGKAPSVEMQGLFDRFSAWLRRVYKSIRDELNVLYRQETGEDLPIMTGEVKQVMDRMLASEEQVKQAEQVRGMGPLFTTQQEAGMDDATWAAYQAMLKEAQDQAITDLTKASVRQMKWLANARSRVIKDLQKESKAARKKVSEEVAQEVKDLPVYRAMEFLKRGTLEGVPVDYPTKLSIPEIEAMYGDNPIVGMIKKTLGFGKYGMLGTENGIHPDQAAEMFGFESGDAMVRALLAAKPMKEEISDRTDKRMLEEYSELSDPKAMEAAVEQALHNESRARFVAVELRFISKATAPVRVMTAAAKQVARQMLARKTLRDIRPRDYSLAEARASKAATAAMKKGDSAAAMQAKQNQLVQNQLATEALASKAEIAKALQDFRKFFKADDKIAKTRSMDLVDAARSILAYYGLGQKGKPPTAYVEKLRAYNPDLYAEIEPLILEASTGSKSYKDLTLDEFRTMRDTVEALWFQSKRDNQIMVEGKLMELDEAVGELNARLQEIGVPEQVPGETMAPSEKDRRVRFLQNVKAATRRVENWADATDGPGGPGPFTKYIWRPIRNALDQYRAQRNIYVKRYVDLVATLDLPTGKIEAPELNYTFGNENGGIGKAELLGAILHMGNESNYRKLLLGRNWGALNEDGTLDGSAWTAFMQRMYDEKRITKADMDWVQSVWDLNEELKPMAQKAHHDIFGYYFKEVSASPVATPFGTYRGGYVPAKVDPFIVRDAQKNAKLEEIESDFRQSMPSTGMGFTKGRVEYNKPLSLDVRMMTKHIDDVIRFAYVQPAIKDVLKLVRKRDFADTLSRMDPTAVEGMLLPWLNRAARQSTVEPGMLEATDKFWRAVRSRTGVSIMFANITNALQQVTGYSLSALKVKPAYLKQALSRYIGSPSKVADEVAELSPFMADRLRSQIFDIQENLNDLVLNPTKYDKMQKWSMRHGYFLQSAFQNQVDVVTWVGAYNQALAEQSAGVSDEAAQREAINQADAAVRLTQGSMAAEDVSRFEVGTPFYKTLVQFSGYFNMMANLNADEFIKVIRDMGWRGNKGKLFQIYVLGFAVPMLVADAIVKTLGGGWDDEDDDGYIDDVLWWFFGSQARGAVAAIPGFGPGISVIGNAFNNKPYDDRMTTSPSVSMLEASTVGVAKTAINVVDPDKEVSGKNVRDVLTLLSLVTGIPLTVLGRPVGYAIDVERGKVRPTSEADYVRGLITGKASEESRK